MSRIASKSTQYRWLKIILISLSAVLLLLFMLLLAAFVMVQQQPNRLIPVVEQITGQLLGRELEIGELNQLELNWDATLVAHDLKLSNPAWAETPDFVQVGTLRIGIHIPSIWQDGPIVINELELSDIALELLAPDQHPPNWEFWPDEVKQPPDKSGEIKLEVSVFPVLFADAEIHNATISYRDADRDVQIFFEKLDLQEMADAGQLNLDIVGNINDIPLEITGHIGPTVALLTQQNLSMDLTALWGQLSIEGSGTIADLSKLSGPDLRLKIAAPAARPLLDALGISGVRDGPLHFQAEITDAGPGIALQVEGAFDEFSLQLSGTIANPQLLDGVDIAFKLKGSSLAEAGVMFSIKDLPKTPYKVSGQILRQDTLLKLLNGQIVAGQGQLDISGNLPQFPEIKDAELTVTGSNFNLAILGALAGIENLPPEPYDVNGKLSAKDKGVEFIELQINNDKLQLKLNGLIGQAPDFLGSRINLDLSGSSLASAGHWLGVETLPNQKFQLTGEMARNDADWHLNEALFDSAGLRLDVNASLDSLREPTDLVFTFKLSSLNLTTTLQSYGFGVDGLPVFPLEINGKLSGPPDSLKIEKMTADSGDSHLDISGMLGDPTALKNLDLSVAISTPDILALVPVTVDGSLPPLPVAAGGQVKISQKSIGIHGFKGTAAGAQLLLDGYINHQPPFNGSSISLSAEAPNLRSVLDPWLSQDIPDESFKLLLDAVVESGSLRVQKLEAGLSDAQLSAEFTADDINDLSSLHGDIKLTGTSIRQLVGLLGGNGVGLDGGYSVAVTMQTTPEWLRLNPISVRLGKSDLGGTIDIKPGDIPVIHADLHSKFINMLSLLPDVEALQKEEAAQAGAANTTQKTDLSEALTTSELSDRVIPDEPLDFSWLHKIEGSLKYRVDKALLRDDASSSAIVDVLIKDGVLSTRKLSVDGSALIGEAKLSLAPLAEGADIDLYLDVKRTPLLVLLGGQPDYQPDSVYRARIKTHGNSLQEWAKNSNGALVFKGGGGHLKHAGMGFLVGDVFQEIFNKINPFDKSEPYIEFVCHAGAMFIKEGELMLSPGVVVRTKKTDLAFDGEIDLRDEKLNMKFNTRSRTGVGVSASKAITPYFKIGGTLAHPRLALNTKGAVVSGGAAVATVGLSILAEGMWDRWVATSKNPCDGLVANYREQNDDRYHSLLLAP
ncbi:MAG: AsmA family protein [Pseudomonadales bacterium]|nr:AsmA family protein [Pseudomonadales bacterium]